MDSHHDNIGGILRKPDALRKEIPNIDADVKIFFRIRTVHCPRPGRNRHSVPGVSKLLEQRFIRHDGNCCRRRHDLSDLISGSRISARLDLYFHVALHFKKGHVHLDLGRFRAEGKRGHL